MCLGVPALIKEIKQNGYAVAELEGSEIEIRIDLVPWVKKGDYVIIHAGYAINVLDEEEAKETLKLLEELDEASGIQEP